MAKKSGSSARQQSVPHEEVDQHEIAVVLELGGVAHRLEHTLDWPQLERMHLAIMCNRCEILRQFEIEAGHDIGLELPARLIPVGDEADGLGLLGEGARDRGFLGAFLDQVLEDADAAGWPPATVLSSSPGKVGLS